jgi:cobalamin biosynthesis Mg chelatase CobN
MSVLALLALACFPVLAHAECTSSSCVQYNDSLPNAEGENPPAHHNKPQPTAKASDKGKAQTQNGSTGKNGSQQAPSEGEGSSEKESSPGGVGGAATGNGGGTGQGSPGGSGTEGLTPAPQHSGQSPGTTASQESAGGSSPLIPILIAILVLAAISVGAVMYRQRRQRRGPTRSSPSPKAS